ncbi:MAG: 2OG-Fe(II) oxygenase [Woeseiaceae bacterium]|nr:2OG-Fe(II) oxygenase [Woeseiaceae bacterium]
MKLFEYSPDAFAIVDFLSTEECDRMVVRAEDAGFSEAPIDGTSGPIVDSRVRNNSRVVFDDAELATDLWQRCEAFITSPIQSWVPVSLNERFRIYRYDQYQNFQWHSDGRFSRNEREESRQTFMVYLNDDFEGGATSFRDFRVYPARGMALCFDHALSHEGSVVTNGRKYVLRTDVMYRLRDN